METPQQTCNKGNIKFSSEDEDHPKYTNDTMSVDSDEQQSFPKKSVPGVLEQAPSFYRDFWCPNRARRFLQSSENRPFQAQDTDILLASKPKSGTTWFKALLFTILNRHKYPVMLSSNGGGDGSQLQLPNGHPLFTANPHMLVSSLEFQLLNPENPLLSSISNSSLPRLYSTHVPYHVLPESIKVSDCKIVYAFRNPLDTIVSLWHFAHNDEDTEEEFSRKLEQFVDSFCKGEEVYGPHWTHVSEYWRESMDRPNKVLFMTYEEMKEDTISGIKKLADFMGYPFSLEEEEKGKVQAIAKLCSMETLKNMEINKNGKTHPFKPNRKFFRKGKVGDWVNQLSPSMADRVRKVMEEKFRDAGVPLMENLYPVPTTTIE